jgi:hypothetical protein
MMTGCERPGEAPLALAGGSRDRRGPPAVLGNQDPLGEAERFGQHLPAIGAEYLAVQRVPFKYPNEYSLRKVTVS